MWVAITDHIMEHGTLMVLGFTETLRIEEQGCFVHHPMSLRWINSCNIKQITLI